MVREAISTDVNEILELYLSLHEDSVPGDGERLRGVWSQILADPNHHLLVNERDGQLVASCACVIVPNLTRGLRPYALVENVVTREGFRRRGYATQCLDRARQIAAAAGCYKMMLMTGSGSAGTLSFYKKCGYNAEDKTAFVQWLK